MPVPRIGGFYDAGLKYNPGNANHRTLSESDIFELCSGKWSGKDLDTAVQVVLAESSGVSDAVSQNPDGNQNIGLFQIDTVNVRCGPCLKDTVYNANVAHRMWLADGGTFTKRWETAAKGNLPKLSHPGGPSSEAQGLITPIGPADTTITNPLSAIANLLGKLTSASTWMDIGKVLLGGVLFVAGILAFANEISPKVKNLVPPVPIPV